MSWGLRQPSTVAPKGLPGSVLDRAKADLANSPAFVAWSRGVGNALGDPNKFGIAYLPKDVWVDKQGNFVSTDAGFPWGPLIAVLGTGAAAGFGGAALAGHGAAGGAATGAAAGGVPSNLGFGGLTAAQAYGAAPPIAGKGGEGISNKLKNFFTSPDFVKDIAKLPLLIPLLKNLNDNNSNGPFSGPSFDNLGNEITSGLALQRKRIEQTQPVFDTLVNMSYGSTPTRYRGAAPSGYPAGANEAPAGPYAYQSPRFG